MSISFISYGMAVNSYRRLAMIQADFIIPPQPPRFGQPAKVPLNDPSLGQDLEASGAVGPADDFQARFGKGTQPFDPLHRGTARMNNYMQLDVAWHLYSDDNAGRLVNNGLAVASATRASLDEVKCAYRRNIV